MKTGNSWLKYLVWPLLNMLCILAFFTLSVSTNNFQLCFTFSQIVIWDPVNLQSLHTLATLGGFAYSLSISTLDPGTLGIGVGDNMLRVWQKASSQSPYETLILWQGIKSKVMVVSDLYYLSIINTNSSVCFKPLFWFVQTRSNGIPVKRASLPLGQMMDK